jgi:hypothetical protein
MKKTGSKKSRDTVPLNKMDIGYIVILTLKGWLVRE